jgi:CRISPR-associated protein Csb2
MVLALEIEFLGGTCFAAIGPDSDVPDWPPQPDRVFSALVATWGAHGEPADECTALQWLETLPPPVCVASGADFRTVPTVFVPPNDPRADRAKNALGVLPSLRGRQGRRFPASRPIDRIVQFFWNEAPDDAALAALDRLARDTAYVGRSASLTRCRFSRVETVPPVSLQRPKRRIYAGRLKELRAAYVRFRRSAEKKDRPLPGAVVVGHVPESPRRQNVFSDRWLILEHCGGDMPDVRGAAIVARGIRMAVMSGYGKLGADIPACVSGHEADGRPCRAPHLAILPLTFSGFPNSDGRVLGYALVPPLESNLFDDGTFRKVLRQLAPLHRDGERRIIEVKSEEGSEPDRAFALRFSLTFEAPSSRTSMDPRLYTKRSCCFATVTPIVLDRHLRTKGAGRTEEIAEQVALACERIGLPPPAAVVPGKHSALQGAASAYPSGNAPRWMRWRLPDSLAGRQLTHAVIRFSEEVEGPLLLGAGRFVGMGLCRSLEVELA